MGVFFNLIGLLTIFPFIPFILAYYWNYRVTRNKKTAIKMGMDVTTFFLYIIVAVLIDLVLKPQAIGGIYLLLFMLIVAIGLLGGAQARLKGQVNMARVMRAVWRLSFVMLTVLYLIFVPIGFVMHL
ncbi:DUF3397 family protein [Marinicrinis sediminis]|uniref:DUF3397 family protein n=1 Tax=Marinicrinis sediminis TaxID=1652465 RepID=A0ABW5RBZ9_9BACL